MSCKYHPPKEICEHCEDEALEAEFVFKIYELTKQRDEALAKLKIAANALNDVIFAFELICPACSMYERNKDVPCYCWEEIPNFKVNSYKHCKKALAFIRSET